MLIAAFEPGKEMAIANFFLAIFCLFTVALPLILITRGDKTEANRNFLAATVNPWSQVATDAKSAPVVLTELVTPVKSQPDLDFFSEQTYVTNSDLEEPAASGVNGGETRIELETQLIKSDEELLAA